MPFDVYVFVSNKGYDDNIWFIYSATYQPWCQYQLIKARASSDN
jgi:hypothetical protein